MTGPSTAVGGGTGVVAVNVAADLLPGDQQPH